MKDSQMRWFSDGSERRSRQKDFGVSPVQRLTSHVHQQLLCDWMVLLQARSPSISTDTDPCPEPSCKGQCRVLSLFLSPGEDCLQHRRARSSGRCKPEPPWACLPSPTLPGEATSLLSWAPQTALLFLHTLLSITCPLSIPCVLKCEFDSISC